MPRERWGMRMSRAPNGLRRIVSRREHGLGLYLPQEAARIRIRLTTSQGVTMLWVQPVANLAWRPLPETQGRGWPLLVTRQPGARFLRKRPAQNRQGQRRGTVCHLRGASRAGPQRRVEPQRRHPLRRDRSAPEVRVSDGNSTSAATLRKGDIAHRFPSFLPDGVHFHGSELAALTAGGAQCYSYQ